MSDPAPFGSLICDDYAVRCDCCERWVRKVRRSLWHGHHAVCFACFAVWYDSGETTAEDIKRTVLEAEASGKWPFPGQGAERVPT